jgi:hypothetical protein
MGQASDIHPEMAMLLGSIHRRLVLSLSSSPLLPWLSQSDFAGWSAPEARDSALYAGVSRRDA